MENSIKILLKYLFKIFLYLQARLLVLKKFYKEAIGFLIIAGYLFYTHAERHGLEKTIIESEKYFLLFGVLFINIFTFPILQFCNERVNLYYRFYEVKLFQYLEQKLPIFFQRISKFLYLILVVIFFFINFLIQGFFILLLPALIWAYLYVYLLMTKFLNIFPYDYYLLEYSFKGFNHYF